MDGVSGESQIYWVPKGQGIALLSGPKLSGKRTEHHIRPSEFFFCILQMLYLFPGGTRETTRFKQYGTPKAAQEPKGKGNASKRQALELPERFKHPFITSFEDQYWPEKKKGLSWTHSTKYLVS